MAHEMTDEQRAMANDWIGRWRPTCPLCGSRRTIMNPALTGMMVCEIRPEGSQGHADNALVTIATVCRDCAHIDLFVASKAGIA